MTFRFHFYELVRAKFFEVVKSTHFLVEILVTSLMLVIVGLLTCESNINEKITFDRASGVFEGQIRYLAQDEASIFTSSSKLT